MTSLVGKWKLGEGSDIMPGLELLPGGPLILKLLGEVPAEFYKIEKKKTLDVEELLLSYVAKNASINKAFQVGTLNFEQISGNDISLCIIQNVDDHFREFSIFRMGPKAGQNSKEIYKLEPNNNRIKLTVEISTPEGPRLSLIKYLTRYEEHIGVPEVVFKNSPDSLGWRLFEFWPSTMLSDTKVTIVQALKVKTQNTTNNENTKVVETVWTRKAGADEEVKVDLSCISRHFGYHLSEGEEVVEFVIKVTVGDMTWFVTHRYREFDAIRRFILNQNPHVASFQDADAKFPGKIVGLGFRPSAMESRVEGLVQFMAFYLENSRYCRQNSIDALCSFLKIPENLSDAAKIRAGKMVAPPASAPAASSSSSVSAAAPQVVVHDSNKPTAPIKAVPAAAPTPTAAAPAAAKPAATTTPSAAPAAKSAQAPAAAAAAPVAPKAAPAPVPTAQSTVASAVQNVVASSGRSQQVAKENLFAAMEHGLSIIKHGRQGAPKTRKLHCDPAVTKLYWQSDGGKDILLSEVTDIITGSDIDVKVTSPAALAAHNAAVSAAAANGNAARPGINRRMSSRRSIMGGPTPWDEHTVYYGTENLRRTCKEENMHLCISLILPDRTLDLQCHNQTDYDLLLHNLRILVPSRK